MTIQLAVKLPDELVRRLDALVAAGTFENRTQLVRAGIDSIVTESEKALIDQAFRDAQPQDDEMVAEMYERSLASIRDEPWEPWW